MSFKMTEYKADGNEGEMKGILTLMGISKEIKLDTEVVGRAKRDGKTVVGFTLNGKIKRSDFNLAPGPASALLGDEVKINIDAEMRTAN